MHNSSADRPGENIIPANEAERLAAVRRYNILDTPPDGSFDHITALAARLFNAPISIVSIVDHDRIWFKSHHGLDVKQVERKPGLCASAILQNDPRILPDARRDVHALANPLVAGNFGLRFYAGVPLTTHDGYNLGTLCVIDMEPREVSKEQIAHLKDLASVVMDQLELYRSACNAISVKGELLQEVNHRINNSLQLVSSLLGLQARSEDPALAKSFAVASGRVLAIAQVHRRLYQSDKVGTLEFDQYLRELCTEIASSALMDDGQIELVVEAESAEIKTDHATVLGLIVNELITNALKHGYRDRRAGQIKVCLRVLADKYELSVTDEGIGLPPGFNESVAKGIGMRVVKSLIHQVDGELTIVPGKDGGTRAVVFFKKLP